MTKFDIPHPSNRMMMPEEAPADLIDRIKATIESLISKEAITLDQNGHISFTIDDNTKTSALNGLLYQARHYNILEFQSVSNNGATEYTIFHDLFPEIQRQVDRTREDAEDVLRV